MEPKALEHWMDFPVNHTHEVYMRRALELARNGHGNVSPNPLVGCVIVHDGKIVGEGWHRKYGEAHAEVNAIAAVEDKQILEESTLYVTLEPCSHTGKTPPCADLIVKHRLKKVVIATQDVNPLVAGTGIKRLRDAGITVITDVLAQEAKELNMRFFTYMEKKRPHIILKWAETSDGFIARRNNDSRWISDLYSRQLVHKWRSEEDAVMVGSGTAWYDNPKLNVRDWSGRDPIRVVIDRYLKLGPNQNLFNHAQTTLCYNLVKEEAQQNLQYVQLGEQDFLQSVVQDLYHRKIQSVIVEGGAQIINSFVKLNLWDEARVFVSPQTFQAGVAAPQISASLRKTQKLDKDWLKVMVPLSQSGTNR
ncbi:MAG TPA: bifunctional diaminohydroxyphosphoribosylaminopyrimidine deaminase/5-amino-6-(5-phosphoribosylamino)uracil reductase RibD [Chryseosolibacter sp.]|nr:bifunctional diaminohydroxyphosphoribosylaminopyrimidine deaminase/5-amino-6-(5-phosphoribosylamino)uracil reductase RibD [Chryseosolibacter sp.]